MSALSLRLPKSLHEQLRELAQEDGISVNQYVVLAVAEKVNVSDLPLASSGTV